MGSADWTLLTDRLRSVTRTTVRWVWTKDKRRMNRAMGVPPTAPTLLSIPGTPSRLSPSKGWPFPDPETGGGDGRTSHVSLGATASTLPKDWTVLTDVSVLTPTTPLLLLGCDPATRARPPTRPTGRHRKEVLASKITGETKRRENG